MKPIVSPAIFACVLLSACATKIPPAQTAVSTPAPACNRHDSATGSHIVDRHDCSSGAAVSMSAQATETALRQANPGGLTSH
jgi:hypothetical protein